MLFRQTDSQKAGRWGLFEAIHSLRNAYPNSDFEWRFDIERNEAEKPYPVEPAELERFELRCHLVQVKYLHRVNREYKVHIIKVDGKWVVTSVYVWNHPNVYSRFDPSHSGLPECLCLKFVYEQTGYKLLGLHVGERRITEPDGNRWEIHRRRMSI